eukprot:CAMPEP_0185727980 /NCGR_PEP_ID=MMETSP1171-20130828/3488_1 /TAXON_ID=374046 /ORGANISM="Helicotheca tamensis, Strain CCMP826" /LENGTH=128 /DNA_ID=CAMNT_0028396629 /DNA_START=140 /DNA_END=526 /DNA_ORIENTATION=-
MNGNMMYNPRSNPSMPPPELGDSPPRDAARTSSSEASHDFILSSRDSFDDGVATDSADSSSKELANITDSFAPAAAALPPPCWPLTNDNDVDVALLGTVNPVTQLCLINPSTTNNPTMTERMVVLIGD